MGSEGFRSEVPDKVSERVSERVPEQVLQWVPEWVPEPQSGFRERGSRKRVRKGFGTGGTLLRRSLGPPNSNSYVRNLGSGL